MQAVILAGGKGTRLRPYTVGIPKPLVPVDDMPILEVVLRQLAAHGFDDVILAVNHMADIIRAVFGDGSKFGLSIRYSVEDQELGTAGPLSLISDLDDAFLVMNGDLLTTLDFRSFFAAHVRDGCAISMAAHSKEVKIDLGVLEVRDDSFERYIEKPTYHFLVSTGIYALDRRVVDLIPAGRFDLPQLVTVAHERGLGIRIHREDFFWLDIGRAEDYEQANQEFIARRDEFLPVR